MIVCVIHKLFGDESGNTISFTSISIQTVTNTILRSFVLNVFTNVTQHIWETDAPRFTQSARK